MTGLDNALFDLLEVFGRSCVIHGDWQGKSMMMMHKAVAEEYNELTEAVMSGDLYGPHGMIAESLQLANVALKLHIRLKETVG